MENNKHLLTAVKAALDAGRVIMEVYEAPFDVEIKDDNSPLTIADKKANDVINSYLQPTGIPIISEENKQLDYSERKHWEQCWIVDPLDGTKEFIKRNGEFTVNIALTHLGVPKLGVIYAPYTRELYFAQTEAEKAYKVVVPENEQHQAEALMEAAQPIHPSPDEKQMRIVGSRSHLNDDTKAYIDGLTTAKEKEIVSKGSSLKFCLVAEGKADVYPRFAPTMEWDTAAGQAICEAVGVHVVALPANSPMRYNREDLLNPWFLVTKEI
ncbi:3'(2'),5'-bisphosphate nucleotidase CysQ [Gilvibacter sediminis]|uniref:3'(2'),5'-bisphosphate nucleotidase CysQ n=1 Tax=Gilvibacter sediminis TaxID=379071 RepID=UPI00235079EF|nr:3'(2'),5'-bisphosphate nucleotidase CysQ [Gilvibacter sediminis]MDC7999112.1 3'(2'),5'-bisphosphate nucleotidase CysQ [Gilvibacter sediminis]